MKVRIEIDENMSEDEIVIRCAQPDERVLKMKRAAESAEGDPEIAFFKDAVQFYPPLDSILFLKQVNIILTLIPLTTFFK